MNRSVLAALALLVLPAGTSATQRVDIGDSHALDVIQAQNPAQYEKVMGILKVASSVECETLPQVLKVQYGATSVECNGALILTSYPAKRRLSFTLDDTAFSGNVVLTGKPPTLRPAKPSHPSNPLKPVTPP